MSASSSIISHLESHLLISICACHSSRSSTPAARWAARYLSHWRTNLECTICSFQRSQHLRSSSSRFSARRQPPASSPWQCCLVSLPGHVSPCITPLDHRVRTDWAYLHSTVPPTRPFDIAFVECAGYHSPPTNSILRSGMIPVTAYRCGWWLSTPWTNTLTASPGHLFPRARCVTNPTSIGNAMHGSQRAWVRVLASPGN